MSVRSGLFTVLLNKSSLFFFFTCFLPDYSIL